MQLVIVMPMHDPDSLMFPHLEAITPRLKAIFAHAVVSVTPVTRARQAESVRRLVADHFFDVIELPPNRYLSMMAELVLKLKANIQTQAVDWLAWEDPFIVGRDGAQFKREREQSVAETRKRLAYVIPMLQLLEEATR